MATSAPLPLWPILRGCPISSTSELWVEALVPERIAIAIVAVIAASTAAEADGCPNAVFRGTNFGLILRFNGPNADATPIAIGTIETKNPYFVFPFNVQTSNGFSTEHISVTVKGATVYGASKGEPSEDIESIVMHKQPDFRWGKGDAAYMLTPELPSAYYYATNQARQERLHEIHFDDTWRLVSCGNRVMSGSNRR